jgi:hypothetical protein
MMTIVYLRIFVLVLCMIKLMVSQNTNLKLILNASLILCGGYDKDKTHSFLFMLSIFGWVKDDLFCS